MGTLKTAITLVFGMVLGVVGLHLGSSLFSESQAAIDFAALHGQAQEADSSQTSSETMNLMNTETALCDQPYFREVYEMGVEFFSGNEENITTENLEKLMFDHARNSGYFTPEEAEGWISHIKAIPGEFIEIYREDPTVVDSCYYWQVAAVGPPQ